MEVSIRSLCKTFLQRLLIMDNFSILRAPEPARNNSQYIKYIQKSGISEGRYSVPSKLPAVPIV